VAGSETVTLTNNQMPTHTHTMKAVSEAGDVSAPANAFLANTGALDKEYKSSGTIVQMNPAVIGNSGGSQPHANMQPYLVVNIYIALEGIFPSRN
jgi:microcystin-dependent protein